MNNSVFNSELFPVGTRVKLAFDKFSKKRGEVVKIHEYEQLMSVLWDNELLPIHGYEKLELQKTEEGDV